MKMYGYIGGTRKAHLKELPGSSLVCQTRLYKKDAAMMHTVFPADELHNYLSYTYLTTAECALCAQFAKDNCECGEDH